MTPTQLESFNRRKAFKAKIAALAKPDTGISCRPAFAKTKAEVVIIQPKMDTAYAQFDAWVERQKVATPLPPIHQTSRVETDIPFIEVREIIHWVAADYEVRPIDVVSQRRTWDVVRPRQIAMFLCKEMTGHSFPSIGRRFGRRDHTTVLHGVRKIAALCKTDTQLAARVESIKAIITEKHNERYIHNNAETAAPDQAAPDSVPAQSHQACPAEVD